jgi:hypothetical protein
VNISSKLFCFLLLSPVIAFAADPSETSIEGLELVEKSRSGHLYTDPGAEWSNYTRINLEAASVEFRKHWKRDQNRSYPHKVDNDDVEKIKSELAELFNDIFTTELTENGGYTIVEETGKDVLIIKPAITELDIAAPDTMRAYRSRSFTQEAGRMTLNVEIFDSLTGDLLEQAKERKRVPYRHWFQLTNSVTNRADAQRMLSSWARELRARLDEARSIAPS